MDLAQTLREQNPGNHRIVSQFKRVGYQQLSTSVDLTQRVQDLGLVINQVLELYLIIEQREAEEGGKLQSAKNKRKAKGGQAEIDGVNN